jgi:Tfp pilus assembly protein PilF
VDALKVLNRLDNALGYIEDIAPHNLKSFQYHQLKAEILFEKKSYDEAIKNFMSALAYEPKDQYKIFKGIAYSFHAKGNFKDAVKYYKKALNAGNADSDLYNNLGSLFQNLKNYDVALSYFEKAIELDNKNFNAFNNKGTVLFFLFRYDDALSSYSNALLVKPDFAEAYNNKGRLLQNLNRHEEAYEHFRLAISYKPDYADAYLNLAILSLLLEKYEDGWLLFEWRLKTHLCYRNFNVPKWHGGYSLKDKIILIHTEQGFGDIIQFSRYVILIKEFARAVIFEVPNQLLRLFQCFGSGVSLIKQGDKLPYFDVHCSIMSLPLAFKTNINSIPAKTPYLSINKIKKKIDKIKIGIVWEGSDMNPKRSIDLKKFISIFNLNFEFNVLQKIISNKDSSELKRHSNILIHTNHINDFYDTALILNNMDYVISIDTSVAHLAGALGIKTFLLLPFSADHRWFVDKTDSPWYPSIEIIRQIKIDDWEFPIKILEEKLRSL